MTPCVWCDQPRGGHGVRYTAMVGAHEWTAPQSGTDCPVVPPSGDRLRAFWESDPDPVPGGGDRLPGHLVGEYEEATRSAREAAAHTFNIPIEHVVGDGPGLRILSDPADPGRSARIKSILDATRRNT